MIIRDWPPGVGRSSGHPRLIAKIVRIPVAETSTAVPEELHEVVTATEHRTQGRAAGQIPPMGVTMAGQRGQHWAVASSERLTGRRVAGQILLTEVTTAVPGEQRLAMESSGFAVQIPLTWASTAVRSERRWMMVTMWH